MAQGAGSSSVTRRWSYDVFLSFRGKDTRLNFVSHLYESLRQSGIRTFIDDESLDAGKEIRPSLFEAIKESRIAIIIFSQNYATSTFCLDELVQIIECFKEESRLVCPVFYHVDPSYVRHQTGSYGHALADLQSRPGIKDETLRKWRWALSQAADLSGWHFQLGITKEQEHIKTITREVSAKINRTLLEVADYPVGLEFRGKEVISLLDLGSNKNPLMVGICGIGGIGKSTIARAVYNSVADNFDGLCFLANVREISYKHGLSHLQETLLHKLVREKELKLGDFYEGISIIKNRLQNKKILLILDDVDKAEQLRALAGSCEWFGLGSRIIITTRDKQLLASRGIQRIYVVKGLSADESLQLIKWHGFKELTRDLDHYKDVLNRAVKYSCGLPLALEVIGSNLCDKEVDVWSSALNDYEAILDRDVFEVLKLSYNALSREEHKEIFLDLACFFNGEKLGGIINMMMSFRGVEPTHAINVLTDKSLIKIKEDRVIMHDLIEDMGKEIVRQQSRKEPGKRNRLWCYEDILDVFQNNTGTDEIEVIILDLPKDKEIQWNGKAFMKTKKLKVLVIKNASFSEGIKYLPNSLCVLEWKGYPFKFLPSNFHPKKLIHLDLSNSCVVLQPFNKKLESLGCMNFSNCKSLSQLPNLSGVPNLTELWLDGCTNLIEIHDSLGFLDKLRVLSAMRCKNLRTLPPTFKLSSLEHLSLFGCSTLQCFPEILEKMEKLKTLDLESTAIAKLPSSICNLVELETLNMEACPNLKQLPASICMLPKLLELSTNFCEGMKHFRKCEGEKEASLDCITISTNEKEGNSAMSSRKHFRFSNCNLTNDSLALCVFCIPDVVHLDLRFNSFTTLPACIEECENLRYLLLDHCVPLQKIVRMPPKLETFSAIGCTSLSKSSKKRVLDQAFYFGNGKRNFILPGKRIPQWLDYYSRGSSVSFWIRDKVPKFALWFLVENDQVGPYKCVFSMHINDTKLDISSGWLSKSVILANHIYICDMEIIIEKVRPRLANRWNHVRVSIKSKARKIKVEKEISIAVHVYRQQNDSENIRFKDPRTHLDCNSWQKKQPPPQDWEELEDEINEDSNSTKFAESIQKITPYQEPMSAELVSGAFDWLAQGAGTSSIACMQGARAVFRGDPCAFLSGGMSRLFIHDLLNSNGETQLFLSRRIKETMMAIIVFSKIYATSTICVDEIVQIMKYFEKESRRLYSMFYYVDPSELPPQTARHGRALPNLHKISNKSYHRWLWLREEVRRSRGLRLVRRLASVPPDLEDI
ncbi:putative disease resistance protein At4g11170 [Neltuma alba]|uniref:putative disease resistance protein At4g11170 n=1 Tax=Neltuma alba TaxID=207710 RepID=UPI0010A4045A|nr:putative disease resistance protein At4g11170 [Prosopis alba]XP_028784304.1 putative disease resistance protein At4g11170 [Prosopis alba]